MQELGSGIAPGATGLDHAVAWLVYVFVQGKFWVLFSLLFGMGFAVMSARAGDAATFNRAYLRRCAVLLLFGVAHAVLLWPGDILHSYAVAALILLAFGEMSGRKRLRSEEHTSELQSLMRISYAVFCLKKKNIHQHDSKK